MRVKKNCHNPIEDILPLAEEPDDPVVKDADALQVLMNFYESEEAGDEEENEVDLTIYLGGMTDNGTHKDD